VIAAVHSPVLNAFCVNVDRTEIKPLVYDTWPNHGISSTSPKEWADRNWPQNAFPANTDTNNHTDLDDIFDWRDVVEDTGNWKGRAMHARPGNSPKACITHS